jgi:hypothetical protein
MKGINLMENAPNAAWRDFPARPETMGGPGPPEEDFQSLHDRFDNLVERYEAIHRAYEEVFKEYRRLEGKRSEIGEKEYWRVWRTLHEEEITLHEQGETLRGLAEEIRARGEAARLPEETSGK